VCGPDLKDFARALKLVRFLAFGTCLIENETPIARHTSEQAPCFALPWLGYGA
jgi:hypothetical protein